LVVYLFDRYEMTAIIKDAWKQEPGLRGQLTHAYIYLSHFQDGIGDTALDCKISAIKVGADGAPDHGAVVQIAKEITDGQQGKVLEQWLILTRRV
jgi:hypothetical protein